MSDKAEWPGIRRIGVSDLVDCLTQGVRDFRAAPVYGLVLGGIFALAGWLLMTLLWVLGLPYLAYPLAMGFAIVAPFAAVGFYTVSDHLHSGKPLSWASIGASVKQATKRDMRWMAFVTGFALILWMDMAAFIFFAFMGFHAFDAQILDTLLTTPSGLLFLVLGHAAGALIAMIIFSISAVSFPMLYDRDIDFVTAMLTSVRLVLANPKVMIVWAIIIGVLFAISLASAFLGLVVVLPIIGHATWHLYRRAIDADAVIAHSSKAARPAAAAVTTNKPTDSGPAATAP
jgi:uncharacterized membrane protein